MDKELDCKVEKLKEKKLEVMQKTKKDKKQIQTSNSWIDYTGSIHNLDYHLVLKNIKGGLGA